MVATSIAISSRQLVALTIPALVGMCLLFRGFILLVNRKPGIAVPLTIQGIAPGEVSLHGKAIGPYPITAPISGKPCFLYRTAVWQQQKSQAEGWEKLADETLHVPFFLDDSTGQLLIEPLGAVIRIPTNLREEYSAAAFYGGSTIPPAINIFLARHRITPMNRILIEECCIEPQTNLFVTGTVTENPGVEVRPLSPRKPNRFTPNGNQPSLSESPAVVRLSGEASANGSDRRTQQSRIAAALVKAGIQNPHAWDAAGVPYSGPVNTTAVLPEEPADGLAMTTEADGFSLKPAFVLINTEDGPLALSSEPAPTPPRQSQSSALLLAATGITLTLASLWIFLTRFLQ